jgi:cytidylate kinase
MDTTSSPERMAEALARASHHWELRQKAGAAGEAARPAFTIALSREAGANGAQVAREIGARLGYPVYDRELVLRIAEGMKLHAKLLDSVDEKRKSWLLECVESFGSPTSVSKSVYVRRLVETLLSLAAHGDCVIVGRGAAQFLPEATTLRVRLICPLKQRTEVIQNRLGITHEQAVRWVEQTDRERAAFVKEHFHKDLADPHNYDLILNTARYSVAACADLIIEALNRLRTRTPAVAPALAGAGRSS